MRFIYLGINFFLSITQLRCFSFCVPYAGCASSFVLSVEVSLDKCLLSSSLTNLVAFSGIENDDIDSTVKNSNIIGSFSTKNLHRRENYCLEELSYLALEHIMGDFLVRDTWKLKK
ncbi:hypothetical protein VNO77_00597 [Canavalia gladiata]|uniref:Secreted protein n=1 Tax=Canavalia gladiata TaxID=3824 RepID=A0AAN9MUA4_CANGL